MTDNMEEQTRLLALTMTDPLLPHQSTIHLIETATRLDTDRRAATAGSEYRRELARTLLSIYQLVDKRERLAFDLPRPHNNRGPIGISDINPESPLYGSALNISPFGMYDIWCQEASVSQTSSPQRHRRRPILVPEHQSNTNRPPVRPRLPEGLQVPDLGTNAVPSTQSADGFMDEIAPASSRMATQLMISLVGRILASATAGLLSGVLSLLGLFNTLDAAEKTVRREVAKLGMRLALVAVNETPASELSSLSTRSIIARIRSIGYANQLWQRKRVDVTALIFLGDGDTVDEEITRGIRVISREVRGAFSQLNLAIDAEVAAGNMPEPDQQTRERFYGELRNSIIEEAERTLNRQD